MAISEGLVRFARCRCRLDRQRGLCWTMSGGSSAVRMPIVIGVLAVGALIAGVAYLKHDPADQSPATTQAKPGKGASAEPAVPAAGAPRSSVSRGSPSEPGR